MTTQTPTPQPTVVTPTTPEPPPWPELLSKADIRRIWFAGQGQDVADQAFDELELIQFRPGGRLRVRLRDWLEYIDAHAVRF